MESRQDRPPSSGSGSAGSSAGSATNGVLARRSPSPMVPQRGRDAGHSLNAEEELLAKWIMDLMGKGRLTALGLTAFSEIDSTQSPMGSWDQEEFDRNSPDDLAVLIMGRAYHDASSRRGTIRYGVNAYRNNEKVHFDRFSFRLEGGLTYSDKEDPAYQATEGGVLAMTLRHLEFTMKLFMQGQAENDRVKSQQLAEANRQLMRYSAQHYRIMELSEAMLDRRAERDLAVREQDQKEKRKQMMFEKFLVLLPIVARKFLGGGPDKGPDKVLAEEQLNSLLESITEEQLRDLVPLFTDEQRVSFFTMYTEYQARKKKMSEPETPTVQIPEQPTAEPEPQVDGEPEAPSSLEPDFAQDPPPPPETTPDVSATQEAPPAEPDRTFECMIDVLGDDLSDEKIGRLAEKLPAPKRAAFLAAVKAKREAPGPQ